MSASNLHPHRPKSDKREERIRPAEVVRPAAGADGERRKSDVEAALSATFGAVPNLVTPSRDEWHHDRDLPR